MDRPSRMEAPSRSVPDSGFQRVMGVPSTCMAMHRHRSVAPAMVNIRASFKANPYPWTRGYSTYTGVLCQTVGERRDHGASGVLCVALDLLCSDTPSRGILTR